MRKILLCFLSILLVSVAAVNTPFAEKLNGQYPFSGIVVWDETKTQYEKFLQKAGITIRLVPLADPTGVRFAEEQHCIFLEKDKEPLGYGIVFKNFFVSVYAKHKTRDEKRGAFLSKTEVLYDRDGRYIFLASYRFNISPLQMFVAKYWMGAEPEAERKIFKYGEPLDKDYILDGPSRRLANFLVALPKQCGVYAEEQDERNMIFVNFDAALFQELKRQTTK